MPDIPAALVRYCTTCRVECAFEQPECLDGHGLDCPEWACLECGEAIVIGFALPDEPIAMPTRSVA